MLEEEKEIILRTEEVNEILTSTPKWIFRWGISVIFILIIISVALSYFIRYPDILTADITLTTLNPPVTLVSKNNGKLTYLLAKNNTIVKANQTIAVIENTSNYTDVLYLFDVGNNLINQLKLTDTISQITVKDSLKVGELTPYYLLVLKSIKDLNLYKIINPYNKQITLLKKDLVSYNELLAKYKQQEFINKQQLTLTETDYNRDKTLFENKVISAREYDAKKKEYLGALSGYESIKITTSNAYIQINSIEKNILQLQIQDYQEQAKLKNEFQQNFKSLVSEISKWKQLYLIESPIDGRISFFNVWSVNQNIKSGDELFSVVPTQKQQFIGKCILPIINTGKLSVGQNVNIKLDNYPYNENGMLHGIVTNISEVPNKDNYAIDVDLKNGLVTSYSKTLLYKEQMKGKADIITKNISVMDRIFFNFKKLIDKK
ncbi:MAG: HlyD family efflux transporter periplasmic adaptor subunit [Flavobacterium sp.]|nr:HlyD family efflux transporter periplasmic adaptor subunit [Flavobacterium sp.]